MLSLHADLCVPDLDVMIFSVGNGDGEGQNPEDEEYRAKQSQTLHASKLALGSRLWNPVLAVDEPISHSTVALKLNRAESPMGPCANARVTTRSVTRITGSVGLTDSCATA